MDKIFLIIICCFVILPCFSTEWVQTGAKRYIDKSSIDRSNFGYVRFWEKALNDGTKEDVDGKKIWYTMGYYDLKCSNKTSRILSLAVYDIKGKLIFSDTNSKTPFEPIIPETYTESYYNIFCK